MARWNNVQVEEMSIFDFEEMLVEDVDCVTWDKKLEQEDFEFVV